jgi:SAM-dependent methyltransferase
MSGGPEAYPWESWTWDETLFKGAAPFYERGRIPYSENLAEAFRVSLGLNGTGRLLDVGCGPGTIALQLAHLFDHVVGLDPDRGMIDEAQRLADERGVTNTRWVRMRAEELPDRLGVFDVITFAQSFHWMDRPVVARAVRQMLTPAGAVVHVGIGAAIVAESQSQPARPTLPHPPPPNDAIEDLRKSYLGPHKRAGKGFRDTSPSGEDAVFEEAGFARAEVVAVPDGRVITRTIDDLVANAFSMTATAPHLFGDGVNAFEKDLRRLLGERSPSGLFSEWLPDNRLRIWRPA